MQERERVRERSPCSVGRSIDRETLVEVRARCRYRCGGGGLQRPVSVRRSGEGGGGGDGGWVGRPSPPHYLSLVAGVVKAVVVGKKCLP